jgi:uncharacterized membrane protein (UPF0136 family)
MNHFSNQILWAYIILLLVGGLIGFLKANSRVSLISSSIFAALLVATTLPGVFQPRMALGLADLIMAVVLVVFALRLAKTKKFMPSGMLLVVTILALAARHLAG